MINVTGCVKRMIRHARCETVNARPKWSICRFNMCLLRGVIMMKSPWLGSFLEESYYFFIT
jgi:hypothetical protein